MRFLLTTLLAVALLGLVTTSALADDYTSDRDIQAAVDSYLATGGEDASLVGGPGSAGYDAGFYIRGGDFLLRINATIQARFEAWDWDDEDDAANFSQQAQWAGDTSGFSLPRATLKFSGEAPCNIRYYLELEFGHFGRDVVEEEESIWSGKSGAPLGAGFGFFGQTRNYDNTREAWIEWAYCPSFNVRMGQVKLPTTRQMMVAPELQQFIDVAYSSATAAWFMPGRTDRNRDHGLLLHGAFGCNSEWSYLLSITNGDGGDSVRNVLDHRTSDNLAYGFRLNWAFLAPIGYEEGALRQQTCQWYGEAGVWAHYYADRSDKPHVSWGDILNWGIDVALGYGGWSFTAAYGAATIADGDTGPSTIDDVEQTNYLVQLGYHFPGTAWEIAARANGIDVENGPFDGGLTEYAFGVNYYLNGHGNKLQLDVSFLEASDDWFGIPSVYPGYQGGFDNENSAVLIRFQWQLAL